VWWKQRRCAQPSWWPISRPSSKIISLSKTKQKIQLDGIRKNATSAVLCALMTRCCNYCGARSTWVSRHLIIISFFFFRVALKLRVTRPSRAERLAWVKTWRHSTKDRLQANEYCSNTFYREAPAKLSLFLFFSRVDNLKIMEIIWGSTYFFPPPQTIRKEGVHSVCLDTSN
jgi:hypothetical protein